MSNRFTISRFLACRRLAVVGVSRDPKDFSRGLFRELVARKYDAVPVNPAATEIEGRRCFPTVKDIAPPVEAVLLMTPPARTVAAVQDCLDAGVGAIWFHRGVGPGASTPEALRMCADRGVEVVAGECPYMHFPQAGLPHRIHGFFRRLRTHRHAAA